MNYAYMHVVDPEVILLYMCGCVVINTGSVIILA